MATPTGTTKGRRSRLLLRGESTIAWVGVALAAILLGATGASAWWLQHTQSAASQGARTQELHTVGDLLSQNVEALLNANDLAAARRAVSEAGPAYNLSECRVVLGDGGVVAASNPSKITIQKLPASWRHNRPLDEVAESSTADSLTLSFPI